MLSTRGGDGDGDAEDNDVDDDDASLHSPRRGRTVPKRVLGWVSSTKPGPFWRWAVEGGGELRWPLVEHRRDYGTWSMCRFDGKDDDVGRRRRRGKGPGTS